MRYRPLPANRLIVNTTACTVRAVQYTGDNQEAISHMLLSAAGPHRHAGNPLVISVMSGDPQMLRLVDPFSDRIMHALAGDWILERNDMFAVIDDRWFRQLFHTGQQDESWTMARVGLERAAETARDLAAQLEAVLGPSIPTPSTDERVATSGIWDFEVQEALLSPEVGDDLWRAPDLGPSGLQDARPPVIGQPEPPMVDDLWEDRAGVQWTVRLIGNGGWWNATCQNVADGTYVSWGDLQANGAPLRLVWRPADGQPLAA